MSTIVDIFEEENMVSIFKRDKQGARSVDEISADQARVNEDIQAADLRRDELETRLTEALAQRAGNTESIEAELARIQQRLKSFRAILVALADEMEQAEALRFLDDYRKHGQIFRDENAKAAELDPEIEKLEKRIQAIRAKQLDHRARARAGYDYIMQITLNTSRNGALDTWAIRDEVQALYQEYFS